MSGLQIALSCNFTLIKILSLLSEGSLLLFVNYIVCSAVHTHHLKVAILALCKVKLIRAISTYFRTIELPSFTGNWFVERKVCFNHNTKHNYPNWNWPYGDMQRPSTCNHINSIRFSLQLTFMNIVFTTKDINRNKTC